MDYNKLAQKHGGMVTPKNKSVDYASLASSFGGTADQTQTQSPNDTGNPFTSPVSKYQKGQSVLDTVKQAAVNTPTSVIRNVGQLAQPIMHPLDTVKKIGELGAEAVEAGINKVTGKNIYGKGTGAEDFGNFTQALSDKYGSVENIKRSIAEDPAGVALDLSAILEGGGELAIKVGAIAERTGLETAGTVARTVGKTAKTVGGAINPVRIVPKLAGKVISKTGDILTKSFAKSADTTAIQGFKEAGITPPVSAITKSRIVQGAEKIASKTPFGGKIKETYDVANQKLTDIQEKLVKQITPENVQSAEKMGDMVKQARKEHEANFRTTQGKIYDSFMQKSKDIPANVEASQKMVNEIVNSQQKSMGNIEADKIFRNIQQKVGASSPESKFASEYGIPKDRIKGSDTVGGAKTSITFENLKETRTQIGQLLAKSKNTDPYLKRMYGALTEDMNSTMVKNDPQLGKELTTITENYKNGIQQVKSSIAASIEKSSPDTISKNILKRNSSKFYGELKTMLGDETFSEAVEKPLMNKLLQKSYTGGEFDVDKYVKNFSSYDRETLKSILGEKGLGMIDQTVQELKKNQALKDYLKKGKNLGKMSPLVSNSIFSAEYAKLPVFFTMIFTGNLTGAASILAETGLEYVGSKAFTTDVGRKLLTTGLDTNVGGAIQKTANFPTAGSVGLVGAKSMSQSTPDQNQ